MSEHNGVTCIVCDATLERAFPSIPGEEDKGIFNQPYKGTCFHAYGQYGSTVYDPFDPAQSLEIAVCDDCMKKASDKEQILITKVKEVRSYNSKYWNYRED